MHGCCHDSQVAAKALNYLRQTIVQSHLQLLSCWEQEQKQQKQQMDTSTSITVFSSNNHNSWMRIVASTMKIHVNNTGAGTHVNVVSQGVLLWMTLGALSPVYARDIQRGGGMELLVSIVQLHHAANTNLELQERCCAALMECSTFFTDIFISMSSSNRHLLEDLVKALVLKLLEGPSVRCREYAVVSLFRMARYQGQAVSTTGGGHAVVIVWERISDTMVSQGGIRYLWELLQAETVPELVKEAAVYLLWRLSAPANANEKPKSMSGGRVVTPTEANIKSVVELLQGSGSTFLIESACGLLASMNFHDVVSDSVEMTRTIVRVVLATLNKFPKSEGIQTHGFIVFRNMLSNDSLPEFLEEQGQGALVSIVLNAMHRFSECMELQDAGCQVVAYACDRYDGARQVAASGTSLILHAFQRYVSLDGSTSDSCGRCTYLASILSRLSSMTSAAMVLSKSRIVLDLELAMEKEEDAGVLASLHQILLNLLPLMVGEHEWTDAEWTRDTVASDLIYHVLNAVDRADSVDLKRDSCTLLALLYSKTPFECFNQQTSTFRVGSYNMSFQRYPRGELETIEMVMRTHLDDSAVQESGCVSLINFWSAVGRNRIGEWRELGDKGDELVRLSSSGLDLVLDVMRQHKSDLGVQIKAMRLFGVLTFVCETKQLKEREAQLIEHIIDSVDSFGANLELLSAVGDILKGLTFQKQSLHLIGSSSVIGILIQMLQTDNEHVVTQSSHVLDLLLKNHFDASRILAEAKNGIAKIILCMAKHPSSEELQQRLCSVVESLVVLLDNRFIAELTDSGCLRALTDALNLHPHNGILVESACRALNGILADVESSVLWATRRTLSEAVMSSLEGTLKCPNAQVAVADVLYALCVKEDYFKILVAGSVPDILRSLNDYPTKADLQKCGCAIIRKIASSGENMDIVGQSDTVRCIVNSMLLHPESTGLVMECLATLHYLAGEASTRKILRRFEVEDACICLLRINLTNDTIVGAVLAALNNIAVDAKRGSVSRMKHGVLDVLLMAIARYPESNSVQKQGCLLLKNYTYERGNFQAMKSRTDDLISLLVVSAETHSEACGDRAQYIMHKLLNK
jgi:hypothetical protein